MTVGQTIALGARCGHDIALNPSETAALARALDVLRRVAENDCTNARQEAADILKQIDAH